MAKRNPKYVQLKVSLEDIEPEIWRRVIVPTDFTLHDLHRAIQLMFEWLDYHLYEFRIAGQGYQAPDEEAEGKDTTQTLLGDIKWSAGDEFEYVYDFGDYWVHRILVESPERVVPEWLPHVAAGARRGPPEDSGGPSGYARLLEALQDPEDPEHEDFKAWAGEDYDPEGFDIRTVRHAVLLVSAWGNP